MGADVILGGRSYDPSLFAALAIKNGFDKALALHMGKILECAAIAALPGSRSDSMFGYLQQDGFILEPLSPLRKCTPLCFGTYPSTRNRTRTSYRAGRRTRPAWLYLHPRG